MKKITTFLILIVSVLGMAQGETLFSKATTAYNEGKYEEAIESYLKIEEDGKHSVSVYFNLGNSYYKLNQVASSIYYYEKALLLQPKNAEVRNNLVYAQNMTLDAIEEMPKTSFSKMYKSTTGLLSFDQWAYVGVLCLLLFVMLYIAFYYVRYSTQKRIAFISSFVFLSSAILCVVISSLTYNDFKKDQPAIVFSEESIVKSEPNSRSQETFRLHQGTKVNVLDTLNDWKKIQLIDGKTGWIISEDIKILKDF
ncbi:MAG: tetratricopeptide repeat protein [Cellulophaga sp.]